MLGLLGLQLSDRFLVFGTFWETQSDTRDDLLDLQKAKLLNILQLVLHRKLKLES